MNRALEHVFNRRFTEYIPHGSLSIKCIFNGHGLYTLEDGRRFVVDDSSFLILNKQPYTIHKDSPVVLETFVIMFPDDMADDVRYSLTTPDDQLLDDPAAPDNHAPFFEKLYPHDTLITPLLQQIRGANLKNAGAQHAASLHQTDQIERLNESLRRLLARMLHLQQQVFQETEQLPAARRATRIELYKRLHLARDYIHACLDQPLTLEDMASVAAMSPHHFLRTFKQVFGQTPNRYLTQKRIERAQYLLQYTSEPVTAICLSVGFQSLGSFSALFRRVTSMSPREFRAK